MKLVRSIFLALAFTFAVGTVAQAADPAPAGEAAGGEAKKEKKAKKGKKADAPAEGAAKDEPKK